jgi:predicted RecB family nuclease
MISASDISNFLACHHLTRLDCAESAGQIKKPFFGDHGIDLLRKLGLRHEEHYLQSLAQSHKTICKVSRDLPWAAAVALTLDAMRQGVGVVYQATFEEDEWGGRADFLIRVETPSSLGAWSYEVVETKLARSAKAGAIMQLCFYSDLVSKIQGKESQWMHVVPGGGRDLEKFLVQRYIAYFRNIKTDFISAYKVADKTYPEPNEHCNVCSWFPVCDDRRHADDNLCLVAGSTGHQRKILTERGVTSVAGLAQLILPVSPRIDRIGEAALLRIREQARLQAQGKKEGRLIYELIAPVPLETGLAALPTPSQGDMFLDLEGYPYASELGLEYLIGLVTPPAKEGEGLPYIPLWSFDRAEEKKSFEKLISIVMDRWRRYPEMHVYHYAPYEPTAIKRLAAQHTTCVEEVDQMLRAGILVDLFRVLRQGVRASVESYSLKKVEQIYNFTRAVPLRDSVLALQAIEELLAFGNAQEATQELLDSIASYNRDDCVSTFQLREWLESRRLECEKKMGKPLPRPVRKEAEAGEELAAEIQQTAVLAERLAAGLSTNESEWTNQQRASWLLGQMLEYHRREDKSAWWEYYKLRGMTDEELQQDNTALGGLFYVGEVDRVARSVIHRYRFPPQNHAIDRAHQVNDPRTGESAGTKVAIDDLRCTIDLKRAANSAKPHPTALIPFEIVGTEALKRSLYRLGSWVGERGIENSDETFLAARRLLLRRRPEALHEDIQSLIGADGRLTEAGKGLIYSITASPTILPIQGPPGTGKTFTGARLIVELVQKGFRVGLTAVTHKVITNLLQETCKAAREVGCALRAVQKPNESDGCSDTQVMCLDKNDEVSDALRSRSASVAAGTAWLWASPEMANSVDVLFVDEAGQMSLANVLAISQAARSIVLLGDPQQLDQPQHGVHPPGVDVSALAYVLNGRDTISPEEGVFLKETWRLHPDICAFTSEVFYDSRLLPRSENKNQRINTQGFLDGTGLRFVPVEHAGNQNESPEEVEKINTLITKLLSAKATWTNKNLITEPLRPEHVLVVSPYNAQVSALAHRLPQGVRIGTVDKFQGQQAPIVFYSMATSAPEDAPRGMEFLYSLNRLNVATSRAQCVAVIVASPALFQVQCKTPRQIELANACCRYLEMAQLDQISQDLHGKEIVHS